MNRLIVRLIFFLVRRRLGLKKYEAFIFTNQKKNTIYFFTDDTLVKQYPFGQNARSNVSLNWITDKDCEIEKIGKVTWL